MGEVYTADLRGWEKEALERPLYEGAWEFTPRECASRLMLLAAQLWSVTRLIPQGEGSFDCRDQAAAARLTNAAASELEGIAACIGAPGVAAVMEATRGLAERAEAQRAADPKRWPGDAKWYLESEEAASDAALILELFARIGPEQRRAARVAFSRKNGTPDSKVVNPTKPTKRRKAAESEAGS